jgi:2-methylaconitate cis-trans-isomerase PrpF
MASAIGPYAYNHGLIPRATRTTVTVRIHNTNTRKIIHSTFLVTDDGKEAATSGDCVIAGVPGTGAQIQLSFLDPAGSKTGALLPTGNVVDKIDGTTVSCIDAANPCVFVGAIDVGVDGTELPDEFLKDAPLLHRLESLRCLGAEAMGMCDNPERSPSGVPKITMVSKPTKHKVLSGEYLGAQEVDLVARVMADRQPHPAIPITVALCVGAAATVKGGVVEAMLGPKRAQEGVLTIGHPSGAIQVAAVKDKDGLLTAAHVLRTSRPIMEGTVYF